MTEPETPPRSRWHPSLLLQWYARAVVWLRWLVVAFWVAAAAAVYTFVPAYGTGGNDLEQLISADNPAVRSELQSVQKFGFPVLSRVAVVQRNPAGLSTETQTKAVARAKAVSDGTYPDAKPIVAAVPVMNTLGLFPGSTEDGTTIVTLLFTDPSVTFAGQQEAAEQFVAKHYDASDAVVGITGSVPARVEQTRLVLDSVPRLELITVIAVFLIIAVVFRSLLAPLLALGVAGIAILLTLHIGGAVADRLGVPVPQETQPLLVALLLGVVTDYVVFYLAAVRNLLESGTTRLDAARQATARFTPIIATAGATAAAGTAALLVADSPAFRAFGPGMALAILIGMLVAVTLVPALLAIFGGAAFWPSRRHRRQRPVAVTELSAGRRTGWTWLLTRRWFAAPMFLLLVAALITMASPALHLRLGVSFVEALPTNHPARTAAAQAETGFADGILSPTELLVQGSGIAGRQAELARLQQELTQVPGIAGVLGPGTGALPPGLELFRAADGTAVRYLLILSDEPLGGTAVQTLTRLERQLPGLVQNAGLGDAQTSLGGDTAIAKVIVDQTVHDLGRIAVAALIANLVFLMLFLRAFIAPLGLLACSVLAIGATLGLTTWVFQDFYGNDGLTFYVPFAAAVLLVALGSDYNIFGIGPAWREARGRPLREALAITLPQSAHAIRTAAFTLAVSLGLLALVPLRPFRELAFALSVGILIDAFIVRSLLAPMLLTVLGSAVEPATVEEPPPAYERDPEPAVPVAREPEPVETRMLSTERPPERA
ncbi:MMPL family transporter [Dactylosporangium aurantiacum]|uniref:MMPL family transporter n=1 Tax=Dactylosporangium aurantiacum TaxID=35754 RepID=A0A9Q9IQJ3_9ACTN|nr:MMPL family transporter [Dactylosporangium aurantiacum]MDG6106351.1 MMPL family transporter [Dactylosporangium aurantiacum]UWZ58160.1 MMPL family transporter [Dactylosporangium aurantiacum]